MQESSKKKSDEIHNTCYNKIDESKDLSKRVKGDFTAVEV